MKFLHLCLSVLALSLSMNDWSYAGTDLERSTLFIQGVEAYNDGNVQQAADRWLDILEQDTTSAELHYNLGNAYFKLKEYPLALVHYKRAKLLAPWDQDILANLTLTESRGDVFSADRPSWYEAALTIPEAHWKKSMVVAWWLMVLFFVAAWFTPNLRQITLRTGFLCLTLFIVCMGPLLIWQDAIAHPETVLLERSKIRFAPLEDAPVHFELPEGSSVVYEDSERDWIRISHQGKEGWITSRQALRILPLNETPGSNQP